MNYRLIAKAKTALRLLLNTSGGSDYFNYLGRIRLGSESFAIPLGGRAKGLESLLLLQPSFKTDLLRLAESFANTQCFIDIGANIGQTMLEYFGFRRTGTYYGFEPNPMAFALLQELTNLNSLDAKLMPWGCSDKNQPSCLYSLSDLDSSATIDKYLRSDQDRKAQFISGYTFESSILNLSLTDNFIAKIDVEGAELSVLRGMQNALLKYRPLIFCEVLHAHSHKDINSNNKHKALVEAVLSQTNYGIYACRLDGSNRLNCLDKIKIFPRSLIYADAPTSVDYVFCPLELEHKLHYACKYK